MRVINRPVQLGLCCLNTKLRNMKPPIFTSRRMILRTINEKGIEPLKEKIIQNLKDVLTMMDWNEENGIKVFRLSSDLFPHKSNENVDDYGYEFAMDLLKKIGEKSKEYNQRITFHPSQYNVVGTPNEDCFRRTVLDLKYHADVLDLMELGDDSVIVVHGGGVYGNKELTMRRWCENYSKLPENVRRRLVLENCERCFSIEDCLHISNIIKIPVVFDVHHHRCYKFNNKNVIFKSESDYIPEILETWKRKGIKPKFHLSEQGEGKCGNHSDYIEEIPSYLLEIPKRYNLNIDIMIEAKMKEDAILYLYKKYPLLNCKIRRIKLQLKK